MDGAAAGGAGAPAALVRGASGCAAAPCAGVGRGRHGRAVPALRRSGRPALRFRPRGRRGADDRAVQPYFAGQRRRRSAATGTRRDDRRGGRCGDGRRAGRDDDGRRLAVAALRAPHGGRRGADDRASGVARCGRRACGRASRGRSVGCRRALPVVGRLRVAAPAAVDAERGRQADSRRHDARLPCAEPHGQPLQRRHDELLPPFGGRLPRREDVALSGRDRPLPLVERRSGARHAQYPLPHPAGRRRAARSASARDGAGCGVAGARRRDGLDAAAGAGGAGDGRPAPSGGGQPRRLCPHDGCPRRGASGGRYARRYDPAHGIPPQLSEIRIRLRGARHGGLLRDLLRQGLDGLGGRRRDTLFPCRLPAARPGTSGRRSYGRVAVPCAALGSGRGGDGALLGGDPAPDRRTGRCGVV